jgi:hypothetical protein
LVADCDCAGSVWAKAVTGAPSNEPTNTSVETVSLECMGISQIVAPLAQDRLASRMIVEMNQSDHANEGS